MEDSTSIKSMESVTTSDEYEFVNEKGVNKQQQILEPPTLNIANNGNLEDLQNNLRELLTEDSKMENEIEVRAITAEQQNDDKIRYVGHSKFYEATPNMVTSEKQDPMKPDDYVEEEIFSASHVQQECTIFNGVTYLGAAAINAPKSEAEIQRNMAILYAEQAPNLGIKVSVSIPSCSQGSVVLYDATNQQAMAHYEVQRILFYARGEATGICAACFAFTWSHGDTLESAIFQCHVFRCDIPEAVGQVSACFAKAFQRIPRSMTSSLTSSDFNGFNPGNEKSNSRVFIFEVTMEVKEEDGKGGFSTVPKDRNCFKFRCNVAKQVFLSIQQVSSKEGGVTLEIERCFGVLVSPGRNVKHSDMRLLEMQVNPSPIGQDKQCYNICGLWDPADPALESLNVEIPKEGEIFMTVAVDLVIRGIREPVRFLIETPVKIFPQNERFWYFNKRHLVQQFYLNSKEIIPGDGSEVHYEVQSIETSGELDRNRLNLALNLASLIRSPSITSIDTLTPKEEFDSDGDEPMLSGTGEVSKDCSADELANWAEVLDTWQVNEQRPKLLIKLTKLGIPEALRAQVWQRLSNCDNSQEMMDKYRMLITKESSCESVILRDINRTFPAHDFFKETGGLGQDSLYRISKAYAVYDEEVGYCQGLSFLVASLLLHMPEEQAFCVLVKLMYDYGLRNLYKDRFDNLHMRFYQLNRLIEDQLPELYKHFYDRGVETHMFAAQWFLTLFTARFPLYLVFHILDVFLLQGLDTLFQVAIALLTLCKKELLQLDFESILKYFRVHLPKRCRNEEVSRYVMKLACSVALKKLKKYEAEFMTLKEAQENADEYSNEVEQLRGAVARGEEEKLRLEAELAQVKEMLQREVAKACTENRRSSVIIAEYKQICQRLEDDHNVAKSALNDLRSKVSNCEQCRSSIVQSPKALPDSTQNMENRIDSVLHRAQERVRELELELAQTKLAHVEAECRNQDLTHQLHATASELQAARNSWPWLSKTLSSIKEAANKRDVVGPGILRRDSAPGGDVRHTIHSQSRDNLKEVV
ncbi:rab GTPase-activating protein 1-like isoform X1 [Neodiprion virginianus]|uniref:rab GTPase-activating protein 1-like isoform X1 n=2 Tax=Neodiprion virginianus TaxID=2961670 RepID=UPI001EE6D105|nr:rab GTPase-activating protein 1-like isoform X1 [Neodiprion virginianus]XP_046612097.1 rab GTPase-activating protein 1-like isoform X1 [Neodiprion virginianus]XP_046612098.1 rab GTPase-activating protein 1-like isoform X1 [Neodiprion virginianus]XP_046612099.1 rab GTPase-activating protein 1-like isoform X1 [Neodiprion virginianus]XP_046612102.1 rab GTPase-activating protein 1-like isoform X1 [Neodiprion virginianus]